MFDLFFISVSLTFPENLIQLHSNIKIKVAGNERKLKRLEEKSKSSSFDFPSPNRMNALKPPLEWKE